MSSEMNSFYPVIYPVFSNLCLSKFLKHLKKQSTGSLLSSQDLKLAGAFSTNVVKESYHISFYSLVNKYGAMNGRILKVLLGVGIGKDRVACYVCGKDHYARCKHPNTDIV